jgi:uncharacterized membrane protein
MRCLQADLIAKKGAGTLVNQSIYMKCDRLIFTSGGTSVNQHNRGQLEPLSELSPSGKTQFLEIDPKVAAYTTYIPIPPLNLILAGVWFAMEPNNTYAKFHATQSLIFSGGFFVFMLTCNFLAFIISMIPLIGPLVGGLLYCALSLVTLAYLIFSVKCMIDVHHGRPVKLPYVSDLAEKYSRGI